MQSSCFTCGAPLRIEIKGGTFDVVEMTDKLGQSVGIKIEKRDDRPLLVGSEPTGGGDTEMVDVMCSADPHHPLFATAVCQMKHLAYSMLNRQSLAMMKNYEVIE